MIENEEIGGLMKKQSYVKEIAMENKKEINLILTAYQGLILVLGALLIIRI